MKRLNKILCITALILCVFGARAQEPVRPVLSVYSLDIGSSHLAETYLSPIKYSGMALALNYERMQAMKFNPERWVMRLSGRAAFEKASNIAGNARLYDLDFDIRWGMTHRWNVAQGIALYAGGSTGIEGGVFYNDRNSNNPAAAKASWTINASAAAAYNGRIGKIPFCARYLVEMPLTGIFFSPEYGELYYEIYLGNHHNLVRGAWPGNFFRLENLATVDLRLGATVLRLGYRCNILSTKASHIVTRRITHTAVIGLGSEWISLSADNRSHKLEQARIISALY